MKIIVLNGSPKGPISVTMQYVSYIAKRYPEHELKVFHVAQRVHGLEKDPERFDEIVQEIRSADGVLWAFPLYILLVNTCRYICCFELHMTICCLRCHPDIS